MKSNTCYTTQHNCNGNFCQLEQLPAYKITYDNGQSYVTSMAKGITLEDAKAYFLGQSFTQNDEATVLKVVNVEEAL